MKTLYNMLLRRNLKINAVWGISVGLIGLFVILLYPYVIDIYASMTPEVLEIMAQFGGIPTSVLEYYATEGAMMIQLFGSIYAAILGFSLIVTFEAERTAEVLYVTGISKKTFFISKQIVLWTLVGLFSIMQYGIGLLGFSFVGESINQLDYLYFHLLNTVLLLVFSYLGFGFALLIKTTSKVMISLILPLPLYVLSFVSSLTEEPFIKNLKHISPFTFADPVVIFKQEATTDLISLVLYLGLVLMISSSFFWIYKKRIHVL
ncbi:MAG: hypothetical protein RBQ91_00135 [Acholeplasma sp.]|nr:hypothetical protein [Acholeplasma sp.]